MSSNLKTVIMLTLLYVFGSTQALSDELTIINEVKLKKLIDSKNRHETSGISFLNNKFYEIISL